MKKLFAIYVGGKLAKANIEVHDMRFVVAASIEDTYDELRRQWWGKPGSLHIDCWAELDHADGYDVSLRAEPFTGPEKLFYVNLGGYSPGEFSERHRNMFVVARTVAEAKSRAMKAVKGWDAPHRDDMYAAEQAFALDKRIDDQRLYLHLTSSPEIRDLKFTCAYTPIRKAG